MANPQAKFKVLILSTGKALTPGTGGELRTHHLAVELSALGHEVDLISLVARNHPARGVRLGARLTLQERHSLWLDLGAVLDRLRLIPATELPIWLMPLRGLIRRLLKRKRYDIVQFEFPWFAYLYGAVRGGARVIYNSQNIETAWWGPQLGRYPLGGWFRGRLLRHEQRAIGRAAGVAACSDGDRQWMLDHAAPGPVYGLVPNGYDARRFRRPSIAEREALRESFSFRPEEKVALFVGSNTAPNRAAAQAIVSQILPAAAPSTRFVIVGKVGAALGPVDSNRLAVTGPVENILPYLMAADVGLNPMLTGSGSNIKIAEYCAAGLPIVTTAFGLRGFEALAPWLAVCPLESFAAALEATEWPHGVPEEVLAGYSWTQAARRLAELYEAVSPPPATPLQAARHSLGA